MTHLRSDVATLEPLIPNADGGSCDVNNDDTVDVADIATIIDEMAAQARIQEETTE